MSYLPSRLRHVRSAQSNSGPTCAGANVRVHPHDMKSLRPLVVVPVMVAMSLIAIGPVGVAEASPSTGADTGSCSWVLAPPQVVQVSGVSMVLATVKPGPCTMDAVPNDSVVCLAIQGEDSQSQCGHKAGTATALIYLPYRPGATYVVTGQGCADVFEDPVTHSTTGPVTKMCQPFGPTAVTL